MLITEILLENDGYGSRSITIEEFAKLVPKLTLAINQVKKGNIIYRGVPTTSRLVYVDPTIIERESANTTNYYTWLFSHILPSWKDYPKRSRSLICSGDIEYASSFTRDDSVYIVLPLGNPKIAIAPEYDLWESFYDFELYHFNDYVREFYIYLIQRTNKKYKQKLTHDRPKSLDDFLKMISLIDEIAPKDKQIMQGVYKDMGGSAPHDNKQFFPLLSNGNTLERLDDFFNPAKHKFTLTDLAGYQKNKKEVWFSSPAVLIRRKTLANFIRATNKNTSQEITKQVSNNADQ